MRPLPFLAAAALSFTNFLYGAFVLPESLPPEKRRPFEIRRANPVGALASLRRYPMVFGLIGAYVIYQLRRIHREVTEHELTHYYAAEGWGSKPTYDTIELYDIVYRVGGCVRLKKGTPAKIALRAALAPKRPSAQDRRVAAEARRILMEADRRRRLLESIQRQHGN